MSLTMKNNEHMYANHDMSCSIVNDDAYDKGEVNSRGEDILVWFAFKSISNVSRGLGGGS